MPVLSPKHDSSTSLPYLKNAFKTLEGEPYFINGTSQLKQIIPV